MKKAVEKYTDPVNILLAFLIGLAAALFVIAISGTFNFGPREIMRTATLVAIGYFVMLFFLLRPKTRERIIERIETPIYQKEIITTIEKPVIKEVVREVEKPKVIIVKEGREPVKKQVRKTYDYVGSSLTETFHKTACRLGKSIKAKYKVKENNKKYFELRGYRKCKICKP